MFWQRSLENGLNIIHHDHSLMLDRELLPSGQTLNPYSTWKIFLSYKHTHDGFLYSSISLLKMSILFTVKPVLSSHSKEHQKLVFKTDYLLMKVKVLQNAPRGAFCNTFDLH